MNQQETNHQTIELDNSQTKCVNENKKPSKHAKNRKGNARGRQLSRKEQRKEKSNTKLMNPYM
jgi:hypothetical protein